MAEATTWIKIFVVILKKVLSKVSSEHDIIMLEESVSMQLDSLNSEWILYDKECMLYCMDLKLFSYTHKYIKSINV